MDGGTLRLSRSSGKREARAVDPCWGALQLHFKSKNLRYGKRPNAHLPLLLRLRCGADRRRAPKLTEVNDDMRFSFCGAATCRKVKGITINGLVTLKQGVAPLESRTHETTRRTSRILQTHCRRGPRRLRHGGAGF